MQLGTRWAIGDEPPSRLPDAVVVAIHEVEAAARATPDVGQSTISDQSTAGQSVRRWTLTWLEGKPLVELDPLPNSDEVTAIRYNPNGGTISISASDPDEEWLDE